MENKFHEKNQTNHSEFSLDDFYTEMDHPSAKAARKLNDSLYDESAARKLNDSIYEESESK